MNPAESELRICRQDLLANIYPFWRRVAEEFNLNLEDRQRSMWKRQLLLGLLIVGLLIVWWGFLRRQDINRYSLASAGTLIDHMKSAFLTSISLKSAFSTPISFYGKVVDQHGNAVSEADVRLAANDKIGGRPSEYKRKTDAKGRFSITGARGLTLAVGVSKPGFLSFPPDYKKVTSSGLFEYGLSSQGPHRSSENAPTVFTLHRIGPVEPLVKIGEKNFRIARDGSPLVILLDQQGHQLVLRCWNKELERPAGQRQYDWRLEINVPDGGLVTRKDTFEFEAPLEGYVPSDTVDMSASLPQNQWRSFAERSYFIRFNDATFARTNLRMRAGGDHFVVWESFLNPKLGSRNLEYDVN